MDTAEDGAAWWKMVWPGDGVLDDCVYSELVQRNMR